MVAERVDRFKLKLYRYLDVLEIEGYRHIGRTMSVACGWVTVSGVSVTQT